MGETKWKLESHLSHGHHLSKVQAKEVAAECYFRFESNPIPAWRAYFEKK